LVAACADFAFAIFDDPECVAALAGGSQFELAAPASATLTVRR
jgi:hypothetical protein